MDVRGNISSGKRLIDADALMRIYQEVLCPHVRCVDCSLLMDDGTCRFETMIREAPAIDAVPIADDVSVSTWKEMDIREKLVELIAQKVCGTWSESCDEWLPHDCGKCYANDCHISEIADHLIINGVTVQETARRCVDGKPVTNADRIRAMSDEELANVLREFAAKPMQGSFLKWLKQPAE